MNTAQRLRAWRDVTWEPSHEELEPFVTTLCDDIVDGRLSDEGGLFYTTTELLEEYLYGGCPSTQKLVIVAALEMLAAHAEPAASISALAMLTRRFEKAGAIPQLLEAASNGGESPAFFEAVSTLIGLIEAGNVAAASGFKRLLTSDETHDETRQDLALHLLYSHPSFRLLSTRPPKAARPLGAEHAPHSRRGYSEGAR
jgi:hypothetical protein